MIYVKNLNVLYLVVLKFEADALRWRFWRRPGGLRGGSALWIVDCLSGYLVGCGVSEGRGGFSGGAKEELVEGRPLLSSFATGCLRTIKFHF